MLRGNQFILSFFIYRSYRLKKRSHELITQKNTKLSIYNEKLIQQKSEIELQKELIETKNTEILDSIKYAKRIQTAILPNDKFMKEFLPQYFILYKPKDIVAGDFYWMEQKDGKVLFAAADCTGHGVPGAMVSVMCVNGLNRSVREYELIDPAEILDKTREIVIREFEKSEQEVKDGMDISLCALQQVNSTRAESESVQLQWAGANNPLWIIRQGTIEVEEYKPNKQPIGKVDNPQPFTTHTIELQQGDTIYIFTDGYQDQFGGEKGKKFKASQLKEFLLSVQDKTMDEQKELLNETFENWRGILEQIDDVCIIGVRI
jgi:serine phosphatase RsbU (regulator of sigma subunit)